MRREVWFVLGLCVWVCRGVWFVLGLCVWVRREMWFMLGLCVWVRRGVWSVRRGCGLCLDCVRVHRGHVGNAYVWMHTPHALLGVMQHVVARALARCPGGQACDSVQVFVGVGSVSWGCLRVNACCCVSLSAELCLQVVLKLGGDKRSATSQKSGMSKAPFVIDFDAILDSYKAKVSASACSDRPIQGAATGPPHVRVHTHTNGNTLAYTRARTHTHAHTMQLLGKLMLQRTDFAAVPACPYNVGCGCAPVLWAVPVRLSCGLCLCARPLGSVCGSVALLSIASYFAPKTPQPQPLTDWAKRGDERVCRGG